MSDKQVKINKVVGIFPQGDGEKSRIKINFESSDMDVDKCSITLWANSPDKSLEILKRLGYVGKMLNLVEDKKYESMFPKIYRGGVGVTVSAYHSPKDGKTYYTVNAVEDFTLAAVTKINKTQFMQSWGQVDSKLNGSSQPQERPADHGDSPF